MARRPVPLVVVSISALLTFTAGCSDDATVSAASDGALIVSHGRENGGNQASIGGPLTWVGSCLGVGGTATVWPEGTEWDPATSTLTLSGGATLTLGEQVHGVGSSTSLDAIASSFGQQAADDLAECGVGEQDEVALFNVGSTVRAGSQPG
ncbi:hypothetical protein [Kineococcus arenarius]|uniref:hypothetical protein n=1 Tax=Kineococcus sp. SYSU DK007 TaxID=3383128 RepID=UPI003D7E6896